MLRRSLPLSIILSLALSGRAAAQVTAVRGHVHAAPDHAPVAYALVRLVPVSPGSPVRTVLTDARGGFGFVDVAPGTYRLRLERIGYAAEQTEPFAVAAGETIEREMGSVPRAVALAPIVATPQCRTGADLAADPALAALWYEGIKGIETRTAFDAAYHYEYDAHQTLTSEHHPDRPQRLDKHIVADPRNPIDHNRTGWGWFTRTHMKLEVPDGREILDPRFLATHCLDGGVDEATGQYTLGFRPRAPRRGQVDLRGELRLDHATLQVESIQVEWIDAERTLMEATVEFRDAYVPGGVVRMPVGALFSGRTPPAMGLGEVHGEVQYTNHGHLERVDP